jgi:hypothetical protein
VVVSCLRVLGSKVRVSVRGLPDRQDVLIATRLARVAGLDLKVQPSSGGLPPDDPAACRAAIGRALLWQAGHAAEHRHKTFLAGQDSLRVKRLNITGQHGEIARRARVFFGDDRGRIDAAAGMTPQELEAHALAALRADMPPGLRAELAGQVPAAIEAAYHEGDRYGLTGLALLDFFSLYEFTRRKGAGVHAWQPRQLLAPFLAPGFLCAVFGRPDRGEDIALHRHILRVNAPDWADIPFTDDLPEPVATLAPAEASWKRPTGRENYDGPHYWRTTGKPLIDRALARGGLWDILFDADVLRRGPPARPDLLVMLDVLSELL